MNLPKDSFFFLLLFNSRDQINIIRSRSGERKVQQDEKEILRTKGTLNNTLRDQKIKSMLL